MDSSPAIDSLPIVQELQRIQGEVYRLRASQIEKQPLPAVVRKMVLLFNGNRTIEEVCSRAGISLGKGRAVARKLLALGMLTKLGDGPPQQEQAPSTDGFNPQDEAFFASEVAPIDECDEPFETLGSKVSKVLGKIRRP